MRVTNFVISTISNTVNSPGSACSIAPPTAQSSPRRNSRSDSPQGRVYGKRRSPNVSQALVRKRTRTPTTVPATRFRNSMIRDDRKNSALPATVACRRRSAPSRILRRRTRRTFRQRPDEHDEERSCQQHFNGGLQQLYGASQLCHLVQRNLQTLCGRRSNIGWCFSRKRVDVGRQDRDDAASSQFERHHLACRTESGLDR